VGVDEGITFSVGHPLIVVSISQVEQVVKHGTGVAQVEAKDIAEDLEALSEFSGAELVVLVEVVSEEAGTVDVCEALASQETFDLSNRVGEGSEVTVEEVVVLVDELEVEGDQESELRQVEGGGTEDEVSEGESGSQDGGAGLLSEEEPEEAGVGLGELEESELALAVEVALIEVVGDNDVLIVLTLDDVFKVVLVDHATLVLGNEVADITAVSTGSGGSSEDSEDEENSVESHR